MELAFFQIGEKQLSYSLDLHLLKHDTVFLHGNLASNRWWEPTKAQIKRHKKSAHSNYGGKLACIEWLGCGQSKAGLKDKSQLEMSSLAADIVKTIRGLGLSDVNIVGHSTGGLIALYALLQSPELFRKALLLDPVSARGLQFGPEMYDVFTQMSQNKPFCSQVMLGTVLGATLEDPLMQGLIDDAFDVHPLIWHGVADQLKNIELAKDLKNIKIPVQILHGSEDPVLPKAESQWMAEELPNGSYHELVGQGHSCNVENPKRFVASLMQFFDETAGDMVLERQI